MGLLIHLIPFFSIFGFFPGLNLDRARRLVWITRLEELPLLNRRKLLVLTLWVVKILRIIYLRKMTPALKKGLSNLPAVLIRLPVLFGLRNPSPLLELLINRQGHCRAAIPRMTML